MALPLASVQLYTLAKEFSEDMSGSLDKLAALGLRNVEAFDFVRRPDEIRAALDASGLASPTGHAPLLSDELWTPDGSIPTPAPEVVFEAAGMEEARQATWNVFLIPVLLVALSLFWWPLAWSPRWFRNWAHRNKTSPGTTPWTLEEIEEVKAAPDSTRRNRAIKDIARVAGEEHVEGLVPEDWLDRVSREATEENEVLGITDDMDTIARARVIKAHRAKVKEEKQRQKQAHREQRG